MYQELEDEYELFLDDMKRDETFCMYIDESDYEDEYSHNDIEDCQEKFIEKVKEWLHENKKIDISKRVDAYLVDSLNRTKEALTKEGLDDRYIHALLIRSLFILFLEDKGATDDAGIYETVLPGSKSYFDILKDKNATYRLFSKLSEHFKGDITNVETDEECLVSQVHLNLIRKCFIDGDLSDNPKMYGDWRLFKFDIIRVELLSEIYEIFLGKTKKQKGQFYTPASLVDLVLDEML